MDPQNIIRAGIAASVAVHLSFVALAFLFSEVRPFGPVAAENVAVDVVTPDQVPDSASKPAATPKQPSDTFDLSSKPGTENSPSASSAASSSAPAPSEPASQQPAAAPSTARPQSPVPPQQQTASTPAEPSSGPAPSPAPSPVPNSTSARNQPRPATQSQAAPMAQAPPPAYVQPQPDLSIKYHVMLGLPQNRPGPAFDGPATENADIEANSIAEFRRHLKSCSKLPDTIAPTDDVAIKLRVPLTRDGRLAAPPLLIEAKASMKGPLLMQAAIAALESCQPYAMLPADKYNEWKVLDVSFSPSDFGAS